MSKLRTAINHYHLGQLLYLVLVISLFLLTFTNGFNHGFKVFVLFAAWIPLIWAAIKGLKEKRDHKAIEQLKF